MFFLSLSPSLTLFVFSVLAIARIRGREERKIANIRQSIHQPRQMYWFGKFWTLKANDDNGYVFVCRIWCASNSVPYFFPFRFFSAFSQLSLAFVHFIAFFPHPNNVCRSISIFEWGQIVTLSLKDGFLGMRAYRKQLLVVACLFIICQTFSGFSSSFRFSMLFQLNIQTDDHHLECVCITLHLLHVARIYLNFISCLKS